MKKYLSIPLHCLVIALLFFTATFSLATENDTTILATKEVQVNSKIKQEKAYFAGGCFWCVEDAFEKITGVLGVVSGYSGGHVDNPTYEQVCSGTTGHAEAVEISYNPDLVSYDTLLHTFWRIIDPTDAGGSFVDRGSQYRSAIFFTNDRQETAALASLKKVQESGIFSRPIVTEISKFDSFFKAENYHQNYCSLNPLRYRAYRSGTGRDEFIKTVWGKEKTKKTTTQYTRPNDKDLKKQLTSIQYKVTREEGTEPPFKNEFWNNKKAGIYVDIISGEPLFSSTNKFVSGTGWPSFTKPIGADAVTEKTDKSFFSTRTEIRSSQADSHLGHVFDDGPAPTGQRYCINSAAMKFVPVEKLKEQGYEQFLKLFQNKPHK